MCVCTCVYDSACENLFWDRTPPPRLTSEVKLNSVMLFDVPSPTMAKGKQDCFSVCVNVTLYKYTIGNFSKTKITKEKIKHIS